jgi:hypothetical protein
MPCSMMAVQSSLHVCRIANNKAHLPLHGTPDDCSHSPKVSPRRGRTAAYICVTAFNVGAVHDPSRKTRHSPVPYSAPLWHPTRCTTGVVLSLMLPKHLHHSTPCHLHHGQEPTVWVGVVPHIMPCVEREDGRHDVPNASAPGAQPILTWWQIYQDCVHQRRLMGSYDVMTVDGDAVSLLNNWTRSTVSTIKRSTSS